MTTVLCDNSFCKHNINNSCNRIELKLNSGLCSIIYDNNKQLKQYHLWMKDEYLNKDFKHE